MTKPKFKPRNAWAIVDADGYTQTQYNSYEAYISRRLAKVELAAYANRHKLCIIRVSIVEAKGKAAK